MKNISKWSKGAILVIILLLSIACNKETIIMSNHMTMGFVTGEYQIRTDENYIYNIVEGTTGAGIALGTRVMVVCDVLNLTAGTEDQYDVRVLGMNVAITGTPMNLSEFDKAGWKDAITIADAWLSGGYLNMYCVWIAKRNSGIEHETTLVFDDIRTDRDTVAFTLVHNGKGEGLYADSDPSDLTTVYKTVSFPIKNYITGNVILKLSWMWHKNDGQYLFPETENHHVNYSVKPEDVSATSAALSTKAIISPLMTLLP